jgi:putative permease
MTPLSLAIQRERRAKFLFFLGALILLLAVLVFIQNMLVSFILAFVTYYLLAPTVDFLERKGLSRLWSTVIPFFVLTLVLVVSGVLFFPLLIEQAQTLKQNVPQYLESAGQMLNRVENKIEQLSSVVGASELSGHLQPRLTMWATETMQRIPQLLSQSLTVLLLVPFLAFFMLLDGRDFVRGLLSLVPNSLFELVLNLNHQIGSQMGGFIRARLLESLVVGVLVWIGLIAFGYPYALLLALVAALLNVIPYLGPLLGALPAFLIALANGATTSEILILLGIYGIAQLIDAAILVPFLVAKIVDLHPVTVVIAVLVGSQLMGIVGMIICIPLVSAMKVTSIAIYRHLTHFRE